MSSVLPSGWLRTLSSTALTPSAVTMLKTGSGARSTRAKSLSRNGRPFTTRDGHVADLVDVVHAAVDHREIEGVILFVHPGGRHEVGLDRAHR